MHPLSIEWKSENETNIIFYVTKSYGHPTTCTADGIG